MRYLGLTAIAIVSIIAGTTGVTRAAEPRTCGEAYKVCTSKPQCDAGCKRTCASRVTGCLKTGSFSMPGLLLQNLKRY
jgi:hypothetical protein